VNNEKDKKTSTHEFKSKYDHLMFLIKEHAELKESNVQTNTLEQHLKHLLNKQSSMVGQLQYWLMDAYEHLEQFEKNDFKNHWLRNMHPIDWAIHIQTEMVEEHKREIFEKETENAT
jgi:hypothetical protein